MRKLIQKFLNRIPKSCKHNLKTFCLESNITFTKCLLCGSESMPWRVSEKIGSAFRESHPIDEQMEMLKKADLSAGAYWEKYK